MAEDQEDVWVRWIEELESTARELSTDALTPTSKERAHHLSEELSTLVSVVSARATNLDQLLENGEEELRSSRVFLRDHEVTNTTDDGFVEDSNGLFMAREELERAEESVSALRSARANLIYSKDPSGGQSYQAQADNLAASLGALLRELERPPVRVMPARRDGTRRAKRQRVADHEQWKHIRAIDGGGQADVALVRNTDTGELGALKTLRDHLVADEKAVHRFRREIEALKSLHGHPGIVELLGASEPRSSSQWLVTRYASLGSLQRHLSTFRGDVWGVLRLARNIAAALQVVHAQGLIHRDLKPANLLLVAPGHAVLADFGVALSEEHTRVTTERNVHTRWYSPPESNDGNGSPHPSFDVYMLGKVIYTMLCGGHRFKRLEFEDGPNAVDNFLGRDALKPITQLLSKMIRHDAGERLQRMEQVVCELDETLFKVVYASGHLPSLG